MNSHERPEGTSDEVVEAVGKASEAFEYIERVRGHLYSLHQLTGTADFQLDAAVSLFMQAGHPKLAERIQRELIGRNVIPGHWTFQIMEAYDDTYWGPFREMERDVRERLVAGRRHLHEASMKEQRRTHGHPDHTARPASTPDA